MELLPDDLLARVFGREIVPTLRLVCRTWKRVYDANLTTLDKSESHLTLPLARVVALWPGLTTLRLRVQPTTVPQLPDLRSLRDLRILSVTCGADVPSLTTLIHLTQLRRLTVITAYADLHFLRQMCWLDSLSVDRSFQTRGLDLACFPCTLKELQLERCYPSGQAPAMSRINHLCLGQTYHYRCDVSWVQRWDTLTEIVLEEVHILSLSFLRGLPGLQKLTLFLLNTRDTSAAVDDLLASLSDLTFLRLEHTYCSDGHLTQAPLRALPRLVDLRLDTPNATCLGDIALCTGLTRLCLQDVTDFTSLSRLSNLRLFELSWCEPFELPLNWHTVLHPNTQFELL